MKLDQKVPYLKQHNVDSGAFHTDPMWEACQPHETPSLGLHSNNVKRGVNGRKAAKAGLGVTGGDIAERDRNRVDVRFGNSDTVKARRKLQRAKTARNRAARKAALVAELRSRGYNV